MRPHRRQSTRLLCPWNSPGNNTGVGCHFLLQWMKVKSESEVVLRPWDFPGKSRGQHLSHGACFFKKPLISYSQAAGGRLTRYISASGFSLEIRAQARQSNRRNLTQGANYEYVGRTEDPTEDGEAMQSSAIGGTLTPGLQGQSQVVLGEPSRDAGWEG